MGFCKTLSEVPWHRCWAMKCRGNCPPCLMHRERNSKQAEMVKPVTPLPGLTLSFPPQQCPKLLETEMYKAHGTVPYASVSGRSMGDEGRLESNGCNKSMHSCLSWLYIGRHMGQFHLLVAMVISVLSITTKLSQGSTTLILKQIFSQIKKF